MSERISPQDETRIREWDKDWRSADASWWIPRAKEAVAELDVLREELQRRDEALRIFISAWDARFSARYFEDFMDAITTARGVIGEEPK